MNEPKYHPLILAAFLLAVFFLILPVQADIVYGAFRNHMIKTALLVFAATVLVVVYPQIVAQHRTSRYPDKWKPRFLSKITWAIVALNVLCNTMLFINYGLKSSRGAPSAIGTSHTGPSNAINHAP